MRHFDVQILGGIAMFHRSIVEMQTGEGKTLAATLPMYLYALAGKGCHLATVNDYLARRDAEWMGPIYRSPGHDGGRDRDPDGAARAPQGLRLRRDLRHGQGVRLRLPPRPAAAAADPRRADATSWAGCWASGSGPADEKPVQGEPYFALVDEADSILIDEARTPLIIGAPAHRGGAAGGGMLQVEPPRSSTSSSRTTTTSTTTRRRRVELTREGRQKVRTAGQAGGHGHRGHGQHLPATSSGRSWSSASTISTANTWSATARS